MIAIHDDRWFTRPWGVNGGKPGARAKKVLVKADGTEVVVGNKVEDLAVDAGDQLHFITWGGGGWGDPLERDPEFVRLDVVRGLVSVKGALDYGVVVDPQQRIDADATAKLRARIRAERPPLTTFDRGEDIAALRERCLADTGLPAPQQPVWAAARQPATVAVA